MTILDPRQVSENDIAIVGMATRVPGARNVREFWKNLRDGVESVRPFADQDLLAQGVPADQLADPRYVKSGLVLEDMEHFDAEFFGFSPKEAAIMDPQHRHFLECAWEALEDAAHPPESFRGPIGVFAGCGMGAYFMFNLLTNPDLVESVGLFLLRHTGNDKDFLSTRVSYLFNLTGPSVSVQTACSTSLVAAHMACQSLLNRECDMALAGGVTIELPHYRGYVFQEGEILSPDGHCRAFDHRSQGTIFGSGAGVVVLRRLQDALADGDHVYAVWKGSAVNNDGAGKVGYLAPSVDGQAAAMAEALAVAGVEPDSIGLIECHGTGTPVGDPIEVAALNQAFRPGTSRRGFCGIGSIKTNIGHLDTAAGVASLAKAALALQHRQLPPSLNFEAPNPTIDFSDSPFFVNDRLREWPKGSEPRRAAVNSLGVGGTNAFAVLEEAPEQPAAAPSPRSFHLLTLSARNRPALDEAGKRLAAHWAENPNLDLADVAYTLHVGRRAFDQRRVLACRNAQEAMEALGANDPRRVFTHKAAGTKPSMVFMFPGGGAQYVNMGRDLYESEPLFREHVDRGLALLQPKVDFDVHRLLFPSEDQVAAVSVELQRPSVQLAPIFILEYAMAQLWISWGVQPDALIGHSLGENTAACVAGVMSFPDALGLVTLRGQLFERVPAGGMLSVPMRPDQLKPLLGDELDLAVVNGPEFCVASGRADALDALQTTLSGQGVDAKRIPISIAAHSRLLAPILEDFGAYLRSIPLLPPRIPFLSNRTGTWITTEQATSPDYWVQHLRHTVMFGDGVGTLLQTPGRVFLEVGPGKTLGSLAKQHPAMKPGQSVIASMRHPEERVSDAAYFLAALGQVWATGYPVELARLWTGETRRRVPLPTYAFQRQRFWIEPGKAGAQARDEVTAVARLENLDDWFHRPVWRPAPVGAGEVSNDGTFLLFMDEAGLGRRLERRLRQRGLEVVTVCESDAYLQASPTEYFLSPESGREGYDQLIRDLVASGKIPGRVIHLWLVTADESFRPGSSFFHRNQERGFYSLFFLAQAMADEGLRGPRHFCVVANGMQQTADEGLAYPEKATVLGPCRVIPRELPEHTCVHIDLTLPNGARRKWGSKKSDGPSLDESAELLEADVLAKPRNGTVAYRAGVRWEQHVERCRPAPPSNPPSETLREKGVYLITGGLGGLGLTLAEHLAAKAKARIVLVGRSSLPPHAEWDQWEKRNGSSGGVAEKVRRIRAMEAQGAEVFTVAADVTDVEQMRAVVRAARERFGAIHGVFHAAGALHDDLIQVKTQSEVEEVFAPKVQGTLVLDSLFEDGELDCLVLFSSTSSVLAPPGQIDYVAANAFLNAFARSRSPRRKTRTVAVNWGVWNEVGMAAEAAARMSRGGGARSMTEEPVKHPMFSTRLTDGRGLNELHASYRATAHWFLDEHRTLTGHALVPGTGFIEMARAALRECGESGDFEINDLFFFRPLTVGDDETKEVRVRIRRIEAGYTFDVQSKCTTEGHRVGWETHAQARLLLHALSPAETLPVEAVEARCSLRRTPEDPHGIRSKQEDFLRFGPRWRVLRRAAYGKDEAVARVEIPARFEGDLKDFALHPALLDFATGFAIELIHGYEGGQALWVPVSYQSIRVRGPLPARLVSWVRNQGENRADKEFAAFDVVLAEPGGRVVVEVEGFSMKRIGRETDFALARKPSAAELEWETAAGAGDDRQLSPAERAFRHNLRHGIKPAEGLAALDRILTQERMPEVIVTSLELEGLFRQVEASGGRRENTSAQFDRPTLDSEFVEPRDDVEKTLVGFWQELLGVKSVGVRDSFFDLGGHSLIAVRLFARIKKAFQVEYPISVLFEAPTIERCAEMIRSVVGADGAHKPEVPESRQRRYKHLVPMHPKEPGSKTPFFLIAGMFGNVLNLRHLAHLIGTDRAFYGVQARGLYGDDLPHETFEEMAADYLAELRAVRPHGPYLLGGFSGGGIAAFEISQQLRADGEEVPLLVLLDTPLPQSPPLSATDKTRIHWQRLKRQGPAYLTQWARNRIAWELKKRHARPEEQNGGRPHTEFRSEAIKDAFYRALPKYQVRHFPGVITLFRPKLDKCFVLSDQRVLNAEREFVYHDNGWGPYADQVDVHEVPGDHDSMVLEPNVRVMAAKLRSCLAAAETTAAPVAVH